MKFNEELLTDYQFGQLHRTRQTELIVSHCATIEEHIRHASSRLEAEQISSSACSEFKNECPSEIVRNALTRHVEDLIKKYWQRGKDHV
jgi:hypothetical protein